MWDILPRLADARLQRLLRRFPAAAILGARQCGKTTLVRRLFPHADFFDLERPSDVQRLEADPEYVLRHLKSPVVIDEAHRLPALFPILRALIDEKPHHHGRFVLLGSAHFSLARDVSESLAGRIAFVDLHPFAYAEIAGHDISLAELWLRGGFPDPCLRLTPGSRADWMDGYFRTFVERDLGALSVEVSPSQMRRLWYMMVHAHGGIWNASEFGRSLGLSYHTVNRYADILEQGFLIRRLQPYFVNIGKRLVRSPKLYLTDSGLLHALCGVESTAQLDVHPRRGASWEGFVIEQIIRRETLVHPSSRFYFWRTADGYEIDLIVERDREVIGVEIKVGTRIDPRDWKALQYALENLKLARAWLVNQGEATYSPLEGIQVTSAEQLFTASKWRL